MARVSTYLNFMGTTEEAFSHYAKVFETEAKMLQRLSVVGNDTTISLEFNSWVTNCRFKELNDEYRD